MALKTNFPAESGTYKFIYVEMGSTDYLWFLNAGHATILAAVLEKEGNRCALFKGKQYSKYLGTDLKHDDTRKVYKTVEDRSGWSDLDEILDHDDLDNIMSRIPAPVGDDYQLVGAGHAKIDCDKKHIWLYGNSLSYKIGFHGWQKQLLQQEKPDWKIE